MKPVMHTEKGLDTGHARLRTAGRTNLPFAPASAAGGNND
jgi:hypothetical protein